MRAKVQKIKLEWHKIVNYALFLSFNLNEIRTLHNSL